jgi:hypothetical protein
MRICCGSCHQIRINILHILKMNCIHYFSNVLHPNLGLSSHDTRGSNNLYVPNIRRNTYGVRSFFYSSVLLWNKLPEYLRNTGSLSLFKETLKCFLLKDACMEC